MFGRRDERAAGDWARFAHHAGQQGLFIVTVVDVYQLARQGTKAVIAAQGETHCRDAWLWWEWIDPGTTLAVALSTGFGTHTHRDGVVYVGSQQGGSGIYDRVSAKTVAHAQRHHRRLLAKQARMDKRMRRTPASMPG
jgi:hypothetical protein